MTCGVETVCTPSLQPNKTAIETRLARLYCFVGTVGLEPTTPAL